MAGEIIKRLFYSLILTTVVSMGVSSGIYQSTDGFEARQGTFMAVIATLFLCIINFILSLTAFLNLMSRIRKNFIFSALAFGGLPFALLLLFLIFYLKGEHRKEDFEDFVMMAGPSIFYLCGLTYHFTEFHKRHA